MKTGVFDSGVGGLTVLRHLRTLLPQADFVYFADTARLPYGTRSAEQVLGFASGITDRLKELGCEQVIIACGTVSCCATPEFLRTLSLPAITALPPAAQAAARLSNSGVIALTATQATVDSGSFEREIRRFAPCARVVSAACPEFVLLAQEGEFESERALLAAQHCMQPLKDSGADTLILGCTHFPLLRRVISTQLPNAQIVDISEQEALFAAREWPHINEGSGSTEFLVTGDVLQFESIARRILGCECTARAFSL